jgi:hypothetical protein
MTQAPPRGAVFVVRRSLWSILMNLLLGALLAALTFSNIVHQFRTGGSWAVAIMFGIIAVFFLWQAIDQLRDRSPLLEIGPDGLKLRTASPQPIPWPRIWHAQAGAGVLGLGGGRVDFQVDTEIFSGLKFGQRYMGDVVVKKRNVPNTFSVLTPQLDESAAAIYAALKRYWPPDRRDDKDEQGE